MLEQEGLLRRITRPMNKDTELHPLVRWQFRGGIPEPERKAFLFENVIDSKGKKYDIPVVVGALAANRRIYGLGIRCELDQINEKWRQAMANPIPPVLVENPVCQEIVIQGEELQQPGRGVDGLPVPISTPGFDNAPYITCSMYISKDPDTGLHNVGVYRAMVKSPTRLGMNPSIEMNQGIYDHWLKYRARGEKMPVALAIGGPPAMTFAAVQKVPKHLDEFSVAGGLLGVPLQVARAVTVDVLVPAEAEIVIEGYIDTEWLEPEGSFGESHGHVNLKEYNPVMEVTAITRRKDAVYVSIISQVTPSESSLIKRVAFEPGLLNHLRNHLNIKSVTHVSMHEPLTNLRKLVILQMKDGTRESEVWRALHGAASWTSAVGKIVIAVNEDIDPENTDAIFWALCYRMKPHLDVEIIGHRDPGHGPRTTSNDSEHSAIDSAMLINAMLKEKFPPISLPKREFMENAKQIWEELGLPRLSPENPWFGYSLGDWPDEFEREAQRAVQGDYWITGDEVYRKRRNDVMPNDSYDREE
ncbi:MAG: UbiD family decarboxylase [Alicyclobacillus sp.]|nr:UbiD family decarboxylase [Alicyclobacillus sp.]